MRQGWKSKATLMTGALLAGLLGCARFQDRPLSAPDTRVAFDARTMEAPLLREFIETNLGRPVAGWPLPRWDLETLTLAAYFYHPSLDVARAEWNLARAAVVTAGGRPNPTVSTTTGYNFSSPGSLNPWFPGLSFDVPIETAGKRGHRIALARAQAEVARENLFTAAWKVRGEVRDSLAQYRFLGSLAGNLEHKHTLQKQSAALIEQRVQSGEAARAEVVAAQLALEKTKLEWDLAKENHAAARARIARALGVPLRALEELPSVLALYSPQLDPARLRQMRDAALQSRTDLRALLAEYDAAQRGLQLEIAKQYPDVHLGSGYQWDQGEHKWDLSLSADLPLLNRNEGPIAEARARREAVAARFLARQAGALADIDAAIHVFQSARARVFDTRAMFEAQRQQEEMVAAQQRAGVADKLDLLTARLNRLTAQALSDEVGHRAELAVNQLEDALQMPLDRRAGASAPPPDAFLESNPRATKEQP